jgi:hypothetical protein
MKGQPLLGWAAHLLGYYKRPISFTHPHLGSLLSRRGGKGKGKGKGGEGEGVSTCVGFM